jgi:hypothetical protein
MKTFDQLLTEVNHTNKAISIAARLKGGINRLKAKIPGTQANKFQNRLNDVLKVRKVKESELDEGRAQPGKKLKSSWKSSEKGVDNEVVNRKVRRAVKSTAKTGAYSDKNITSKDPKFAKVDHYIDKSNKRYNSNFYVKPGRLGEDELEEGRSRKKIPGQKTKEYAGLNRKLRKSNKEDGPKFDSYLKRHSERHVDRYGYKMSEDEQLGPNAEMVQQVKKNLKLESIKPLAHGKIEKVGNVIRLRSTVGGKVTKKQHTIKEDELSEIKRLKVSPEERLRKTQKEKAAKRLNKEAQKLETLKKRYPVKEQDHEDDIEYAIRSKAPAPKPVKEAESTPKPEPKKVNRLKYFLDRAKKKETIGERDE